MLVSFLGIRGLISLSPGDARIQGPCRRIVLCKPLTFPFNHNVCGKFKRGVFWTAAPVICYPSAKWRQQI